MIHRWANLAMGFILLLIPAMVAGQSIPAAKLYSDCIVRYAGQAASPQAASILQRACFYKYRYGKDDFAIFGADSDYKKLAKVYTPAVCDCIFEKMTNVDPAVPATKILDECIKNSKKLSEPSAR
jgi:hypothetical protein